MKKNLFISWNIRGLGSLDKKAAVKRLVQKLKPSVLFIQESKLQVVNDRIFSRICGNFLNLKMVFSGSAGAAGGLISLWDPNFFECESSWIGLSFIVLLGKFVGSNIKCVLVNVYAPSLVEDRKELFVELIAKLENLKSSLIIGGDFNTVRDRSKRLGVSFNKRASGDFVDFIEALGLSDMPPHGSQFTWSNYRDAPSFSRLDRFLVSDNILVLWPDLFQQVLPKSISDHNPVCLSCIGDCWGPRPFKWFESTLDSLEYVDLIVQTCSGSSSIGIMPLLSECKKSD
ncbi:hypothetical protein HRI_000010200 [Hibiscus trionum]|uniref:Endonuclease/exonuclease/phosphatase domain-containing protein n=1 Tax=Hibiscus trionum TaxID=183268 RepID=A0A9W7LGR4_HIBTR|nr:hypothetical protein HRI_000010200 [Hibiscus trionum]